MDRAHLNTFPRPTGEIPTVWTLLAFEVKDSGDMRAADLLASLILGEEKHDITEMAEEFLEREPEQCRVIKEIFKR